MSANVKTIQALPDKGLMVESNLGWGSQPFQPSLAALKYGVSITDACIDWEATRALLLKAHGELGRR